VSRFGKNFGRFISRDSRGFSGLKSRKCAKLRDSLNAVIATAHDGYQGRKNFSEKLQKMDEILKILLEGIILSFFLIF
jgi:hypothetical protein